MHAIAGAIQIKQTEHKKAPLPLTGKGAFLWSMALRG